MLWIRTEGNPVIGLGHVMRCLSIAEAMRLCGEEVTFIFADDHMSELVRDLGYPVVLLNTPWNDIASELEIMRALIARRTITKLLVDSYLVTPDYLQNLCELTYVIYLDDVNAFHYPCHMLINYHGYTEKFNYLGRYPDTTLLLGCRYVPLRREFHDLSQRVLSKDVKSVLVTTGGTDPGNTAEKLTQMVKELKDLRHLEFQIITGRDTSQVERLKKTVGRFPGVVINKYMTAEMMAQKMTECDIAVSAGGATLYELCACGTPTVVFSFVGNQSESVTFFSRGYMIGAGDIRDNEVLCLDRMVEGIRSLVSDYELRRELAGKTQDLIDGRGALRIAEKVRECGHVGN
ncbi:MAG: UDP-2,4-diacetamido-2,4,6-trideoxy-beta-L-altropyranose hydrolase [Peptococcaceae bacterium]|nr:UDP-2,4-diacetamido-2,4,6-trideoxy-beta-L-altropyranose hydrolase [Peptococcaceae bacterium]